MSRDDFLLHFSLFLYSFLFYIKKMSVKCILRFCWFMWMFTKKIFQNFPYFLSHKIHQKGGKISTLVVFGEISSKLVAVMEIIIAKIFRRSWCKSLNYAWSCWRVLITEKLGLDEILINFSLINCLKNLLSCPRLNGD